MRIQMRAARVLQDAGRELPLDVGQVYDVPPPVATALIATGAAFAVEETVVEHSRETKPMRVPETAAAGSSKRSQ